MPLFPTQPRQLDTMDIDEPQPPARGSPEWARKIRVRNRRKLYLDRHPEYFGPSLELADPLLYDRLVRRFQTAAEREAEGRAKGYTGILEADLMRSEAKLDALAHPDPNSIFQYRRGPNGEILTEENDEIPQTKEEGMARWKWEMELRFVRGDDHDFDYPSVDDNEEWDDRLQEERDRQDAYFAREEPSWAVENGRAVRGETGIQDY
ncbi:hypothetical protein NA57DRAFT_70345 [Rhizodiscina lignyota]|uniref:CCD97-like C-terminal domain-containing protein n=1 Tax=Rhizodiscina lignyota TaxID=1504668 RepID=A0A9P4IQB9_9PEZI|nr:hypothetical protein NA57DRAFT_70345 [Rhizodiscina lignyota]